jgi:hypothetical protein
MGAFNWILKNGPGSPGSTAKVYVREYLKAGVSDHADEWEGVFHALFMKRYLANQQMGFRGGSTLNRVNASEMVESSDGDLALFVFNMMYIETSNFRNNIRNTFMEVTKVIHDVVRESIPKSLKYDLDEFRLKANQAIYQLS